MANKIKIRIPVLVDEHGRWSTVADHFTPKGDFFCMEGALFWDPKTHNVDIQPSATRTVWVTAEIPLPEVAEVSVVGKVVEEELAND